MRGGGVSGASLRGSDRDRDRGTEGQRDKETAGAAPSLRQAHHVRPLRVQTISSRDQVTNAIVPELERGAAAPPAGTRALARAQLELELKGERVPGTSCGAEGTDFIKKKMFLSRPLSTTAHTPCCSVRPCPKAAYAA